MGNSQDSMTDGNGGERKDLLTKEDIEKINELQPIFENFYKYPTLENYKKIRGLDQIYKNALGDVYSLYIDMLRYSYPNLNEPMAYNKRHLLEYIVSDLLDPKKKYSAMDLDKLWTLYYATGELRYPDRIALVANDTKQNLVVRGAAQWSHGSHKKTGRI